MPYLELRDQITLSELMFHTSKRSYSLFSWSSLRLAGQATRFFLQLHRFKTAFGRLQRHAIRVGYKRAIEQDGWLKKLYFQTGQDFLRERKLIQLGREFLAQGVYSVAFARPSEINAFMLLHYLGPLIVPIYRYHLRLDKLIRPFKKRISLDSIQSLEQDGSGHIVRGKKGNYHAQQLIVATSPRVTKRLLNLSKINPGVSVHVYQVEGELLTPFKAGARVVRPAERCLHNR